MARRKQRRPQHLESEQELAHSLQNGIGSASDTEEDEHVCGKCRAEFPCLSDFLQHKKQCVSKRPVLVDPPHDSSLETDEDDEADEINSERMSPPPSVDRNRLQLTSNLFWGGFNPFLLMSTRRTDTNVTLEELKNTNVAVAQHSHLGEAALGEFISKFRQSQVESLQLLKSLEHIIVQNALATAAAQPALIGTAALTPPQSADGPPHAPSAPSSITNLAAYPQGGRTEDDPQVPLPENSLALLEKQTERYLQDSMSRRSFILNGIEDDKSKRNKTDDPSMRHRCSFCGKLLGSDSALQIHRRSHTGEKPFSCNVCGSSFSTRGNLKVHCQRHREDCELAAAAAVSTDGQRKHQSSRSCERRPENPPVLYPNNNHKGDSSKEDQALDFSATVNGRKSPNDDNSRSISPNDMSNFSDNSDGSSDENMTSENFSELKIDVERFDDDGDNSNMDDDESEMASSQTGFGASPNFAPYFLPSSYENFATSTPHQQQSNNNANNNGTPNNEGSDSILQDPTYYQDLLPRIGSNDNSWESLIEVTKTSETSKLQQLVDNIEHKLIEPNQCIICHRVLSCKSALQMHYRTHTGERPFKCKLCSRAFTTKGNLKTHMGVHRTKPPARLMHQCPVCHKPFPNTLLLQQHIRNHTENPSLQLTPFYAPCDDRPPTLLPPSYPRQFLIPPQLVNSEPLALTSNKAQESKNESPNESVIKTTGVDSNMSQNPCPSPALSSSSSCSPSCNMDENTSKELQPPVLDLAQPDKDDINDDKMDHSPSDIPRITEDNGSPERESHDKISSPIDDRSDYDEKVKQEPPNLMHSPRSIVSNQENENRSPSNISVTSPPKFSHSETSMIVSLPSDRPLPMTLPSDCPLPFSVHNSNRPYPPMSVPDFTTSLTALENQVKGINRNSPHPLPYSPHFNLGLNLPTFYRDYSYPPKPSISSPSTSKNGSEGSADERSTPGSGIPTIKSESPRTSMMSAQSVSKSENSNGVGALDLTPRNSPGFQRPAGTELKIFAPVAGLPFGTSHHRISTTCRVCYKTFACQSALEIHYRSHTKERPFRCEVCDRGFSTKGNMRQHMLTHKIRDLPSQVFSTNSNTTTNTVTTPKLETIEEKSPKKSPEESLKRPPTDGTLPLPQPKRPPGQPKHLCQVCNKPFSSGSALQIHMRTHTGDKPFQCNICHRAFTTKGNLKVHMGTHMWNNSTSRRGRRMSLDISPLQLTPGAKPGEFTQASYFPYLPPFMNGLPPHHPPPKMNEISVIQTAGVSNGSVVTAPPSTSSSSAPSNPQQPLPLLSSSKREGQLIPPPNQIHVSQGNDILAIMPPPEISVSWPWKISCKVCNEICSSSTELEMHVQNNHRERESPETPSRTENVP